MLAQNIGALILLLIGLYCSYLGYRRVPPASNEPFEWQQWHAKWGMQLKVAGPAMIAIGLFTFAV